MHLFVFSFAVATDEKFVAVAEEQIQLTDDDDDKVIETLAKCEPPPQQPIY